MLFLIGFQNRLSYCYFFGKKSYSYRSYDYIVNTRWRN